MEDRKLKRGVLQRRKSHIQCRDFAKKKKAQAEHFVVYVEMADKTTICCYTFFARRSHSFHIRLKGLFFVFVMLYVIMFVATAVVTAAAGMVSVTTGSQFAKQHSFCANIAAIGIFQDTYAVGKKSARKDEIAEKNHQK